MVSQDEFLSPQCTEISVRVRVTLTINCTQVSSLDSVSAPLWWHELLNIQKLKKKAQLTKDSNFEVDDLQTLPTKIPNIQARKPSTCRIKKAKTGRRTPAAKKVRANSWKGQ